MPAATEVRAKYESVIGLEVHVQLLTKSKIFCSCSTRFGDPPNSNVCPVCLGLPGALPVLNREVVTMAMKAAMALNCALNPRSRFARKNYFYPDLPKGYQISQYDEPLSQDGWIEIEVHGARKRVGITRVHLEEDAGKSLHEGFPDSECNSYIDLNRSGVPLVEIVSEPDLRAPEEAYDYLTRLKSLLLYLEVSNCNMEEGSLRCDANVSVRQVGASAFGTKTEVKNLNSFRFLQKALEYEIERQIEIVEDGGTIHQETRLWDSREQRTYGMRSKEFAHDYRYFPEPDLPPLQLSREYVERVRAGLPELPQQLVERLRREHGLSAYDAALITAERDDARSFEALVAAGVPAKAAANWLMGEVARLSRETRTALSQSGLGVRGLAALISLVEAGSINGPTAKQLLEELYLRGGDPGAVVRERGLAQVSDTEEIGRIVSSVIEANAAAAADFRGGKEQALHSLVGQVMKATRGRADARLVNRLLRERLSG